MAAAKEEDQEDEGVQSDSSEEEDCNISLQVSCVIIKLCGDV